MPVIMESRRHPLVRSSAVFFALAATLTATVPALAQATVQGHIEEFDGVPQRLSRPTSKAVGGANPSKFADKKGLSLSAGTTGSILSPSNFKFQTLKANAAANPSGSSSHPLRLPGGATEVDENSRELTVAWEEWHKKVVGALYQRWKTGSDIEGEARVTVTVKRDGQMEFIVYDFEQPQVSSYDPAAEEAFKQAVHNAIAGVEGSSILEFPTMSQRQEVKLSTTFSMNMSGASGYTYKHDDYEHVHLPGSGR